ncbi:MAG: EpsI family protein [Polaromonas sp.]|jgi:EpsI family protein|nr:EpsI family protein [Polaromonas sp.]
MHLTLKNLTLLALMLASAAWAWAMRPTTYLAEMRPKVDLAQIIPSQFADWRELKQSNRQIINPQQDALQRKLYSQTLARSYINSSGAVVMLSIAYGANQSDAVALHYPEICYPAQGFQIISKNHAILTTEFADLPVKRLITKLGNRTEPVTYWSTMGDKVVKAGLQTKLAQMSYGMNGQIPDGLIFRVSTIGPQTEEGFTTQDSLVRKLLAAMPEQTRVRFAGSPSQPVLTSPPQAQH